MFSWSAFAQQVHVEVTIQAQHLSFQDRDELSDLDQKLSDYINSTQFSDENQDIIINANLQIIIETVTNRGSEKLYKAQFLLNSPSGENYYDKNCEFTYYPSQPFDFYRSSFDPLLTLVDYYIYIILAGEMDTYELLSGNPFYDKAQDLANQGQLSQYPFGWQNRLEEVLTATNADHAPLREAKFYYYEGLYFVEEENNPENVRKFSKGVVDRLYKVYDKDPTSAVLKRFFDAHYQEMRKLLQYDKDKNNVNTLIKIDPRHRDTYAKIQVNL